MDSQIFLRRLYVAMAIFVALGLGTTAWADDVQTTTTITTKKMCPVCGKKIVTKMLQIDGVERAQTDVKSKTFVVVPTSGRVLSPRALWDTVLAGGEQPIRLAGPSGVFEKKPAF